MAATQQPGEIKNFLELLRDKKQHEGGNCLPCRRFVIDHVFITLTHKQCTAKH